ncbi:MAG: hypothetical protein CSA34_06605 [Desulfobulbus propionicus]|nr:MAG: hypothetical protein CSA34_06605 [Desulfobulbus propionicus]
MQTGKQRAWTIWLVVTELVLLVTAGGCILLYRMQLLALKPALLGVAGALFLVIFMGMFSLLVILVCVVKGRSGLSRWALLAVLFALPTLVGVLVQGLRSVGVPSIHDISTDLEDPPRFVRAAELRDPQDNPLEYAGVKLANRQRQGYPEIGPQLVALPAREAFVRCLEIAGKLGWEVTVQDPDGGRIEAVDQSLLFGFIDDIVIRIRSVDDKSRVDLRSVSRVGVSDLGVNARRIKAFQEELNEYR